MAGKKSFRRMPRGQQKVHLGDAVKLVLKNAKAIERVNMGFVNAVAKHSGVPAEQIAAELRKRGAKI